MSPYLFHLYGGISIHIYGVCIAAGLTLGLLFLAYDKKAAALIPFNKQTSLLSNAIIISVIGGRFLWAFEHWQFLSLQDVISFWLPGYSVLGALLAGSIYLFTALYTQIKNPLLYLDRLAIYAPFVQAIGRVGCFFTGCCHGLMTTCTLAVVYQHPDTVAPLGIPLHPVQLYSAAFYICLFIYLYLFQNHFKKTGHLTALYILAASIERFSTDFLRTDHANGSLSFAQMTAILTVGVSICVYFYSVLYAKQSDS